MESFGLEGTFKGPLVHPRPCNEQGHPHRLLRAPSNLTLNVSGHGASTTSLGNLFQCLTTLSIKHFFLTSSLKLPSSSFKPLRLVLSLQALLKSLSASFF